VAASSGMVVTRNVVWAWTFFKAEKAKTPTHKNDKKKFFSLLKRDIELIQKLK
jgi:hypothetical protein